MEGQTLLFFKLTLLFFKLTLLMGRSSAAHCDRTTTAQVREGNLGQSDDFKWLGVLHVRLSEWDKLRIAISGIVLIRNKYALANADDVARIPPNIFKTNSKAMFLAARNTPWYVKPATYVTHPEYESSTLNTIAVVELSLDDTDDFPLTPICLPTPDTFSASRYLYLMGFTDDNQMLEKVIYKIQYIDNTVCEEFYNRTVVPSVQLTPSAYLCGYAPNSVTQCVWENGMVLVSNATGSYDLIGFGIHGPGCADPARFIDLFPYFSWINSVTSPDEVYDDGDGFRRMKEANKFIPNVPIQELYTMKGSRRLSHDKFERYPFDVDALKFHLVEPSMEDASTLLIIPFSDIWQEHEDACSKPAIPMYKEYFELTAKPGIRGTAIYKIDCRERSDAMLSFKEEINPKENTELIENSGETPEQILKYFPINERTEEPKTKLQLKDNKMIYEPRYVEDSFFNPRTVFNYDLYIKFEFTARAVMKFEMLAKPFNRSVGWLLPTTTSKITKTTTPSKTWDDKPETSEPTTPSGTWDDKPQTSEPTTPSGTWDDKPQTSEPTTPSGTWDDKPQTSEPTTPSETWDDTPQTSKTTTPSETWDDKPETSERTTLSGTWDDKPQTSKTTTPSETWDDKPETSKPTTPSGTWDDKPQTSKTTTPSETWDDKPETSEPTTPSGPWDDKPQTSKTTTPSETWDDKPETSEPTTPSGPWDDKPQTSKTTTPSETWDDKPETSEPTTPSGPWDDKPQTSEPKTLSTSKVPFTTRKKSRVNKNPRSHWGMVNWADKMFKEAEVSVVADVGEVQETESGARSEGAPGAVVVVCWLVSACLRKAFFVY